MKTNIMKTIGDIEEEIFYLETIRVVFKVPSDIKLSEDLSVYKYERAMSGSSNIKQFIQTRLSPFIEYFKNISNIDNISDLDIVTIVSGYGDNAYHTDSLDCVRKSYKSGRRDK